MVTIHIDTHTLMTEKHHLCNLIQFKGEFSLRIS